MIRLHVRLWKRPWWGLGLLWQYEYLVVEKEDCSLREASNWAEQFRALGGQVRVEDVTATERKGATA